MTACKPCSLAKATRKPPMTVAQKWRFRRNLTIYLASQAGLSHRFLADVFDLPRSRIGTIIKGWKAVADARKADRDEPPETLTSILWNSERNTESHPWR